MSKKKKFIRIALEGSGSYIERPKDMGVLGDTMLDDEPGTVYKVSLVEMTEKEYAELPKFTPF